MIEPFIFLIVFFGYFISLVFYFVNFELQKESLFIWGKQTVSVTLFLHFIFILGLLSQKNRLPGMIFLEYTAPFVVLLLAYGMEWRYRARYLMLFSLPIVLLVSLLAMLHSQPAAPGTASRENDWLWLHTGLILAGLAGLITAVSSAAMYLLQSAQLKSRHPGNAFLKLPALDTLDKIHFRSLVWGVLLLSIGILSGFFWVKTATELGSILRDPKVIVAFLTCLMYWLILSLRLSSLRRGHKIAVSTMIVFALLFVTLMSFYYSPSQFHKGI